MKDLSYLTGCCTVYNIAEYAEGGPSLQPNMQDGFGYLEAVAHMPGIDPYID